LEDSLIASIAPGDEPANDEAAEPKPDESAIADEADSQDDKKDQPKA
jgi:hypothetical protein